MNYDAMKKDTDVLGHIRKLNAEQEARAKLSGATFYGLYAESLADEYETVYDFELAQAMSAYSDCYKAERGFRPHLNPDWTLAQVEEKLARL